MKIVIAHNSYQNAGGEDFVAATEARLLQEAGHEVVWYRRHNDQLLEQGTLGYAGAGLTATWSQQSYRSLRDLLRRRRPDIVHFHNTFPLISPSAYYACADEGIAVVQTLHNYRLLCPSALFFRSGQVCEQCIGRSLPWPGLVHRCYRGSAFATAAVVTMLTTHRFLGSWSEKISAYIALSRFAKKKFVEGGLPAERIFVKPNCVHPDPQPKEGPGSYALFVGRLSEEKGVRVLLEAWRKLSASVPLTIAGNGPLADQVGKLALETGGDRVRFLGQVGRDEIFRLLKQARFLVFPSVLYENFPVSIAEAFATGVPVIASRLGAMTEIVQDGQTGLHVVPGDSADLSAKVEWAWNHIGTMEMMGRQARQEYLAKYAAARNRASLIEIYELSIHTSPAACKERWRAPAPGDLSIPTLARPESRKSREA